MRLTVAVAMVLLGGTACSHTMSATERMVVEYKNGKKCSEPPPAAFQNLATAVDNLAKVAVADQVNVSAANSVKVQKQMVSAYDQSERLLVMQYALFRVCEMEANGLTGPSRDSLASEVPKIVAAVMESWRDQHKERIAELDNDVKKVEIASHVRSAAEANQRQVDRIERLKVQIAELQKKLERAAASRTVQNEIQDILSRSLLLQQDIGAVVQEGESVKASLDGAATANGP